MAYPNSIDGIVDTLKSFNLRILEGALWHRKLTHQATHWIPNEATAQWVERRIKVLKTKRLIAGSSDPDYWEPYEEGE